MGGGKTEVYFFVHIDKKVDISPFKEIVRQDNVTFVEKRIRTTWGAYSQCRYQKSLIQECLLSGKPFDRIFFLSGLDYPLWGNKRIAKYLEDNPDKELIKGMNLTECCNPPKAQNRIRLYYHRDWPFEGRVSNRLVRETLRFLNIKKNNYIDDAGVRRDVYFGSSWWCLTYGCLTHIYDTMTSNKAYEKYFKTAFAPDEMLVQTIVFNSPYASKAILHEGPYPGLVGLTPLHYIEYGKSIATYTENDYDKLLSSGKMFFRKVRTGVSDKLMDMIDRHRDEEDRNG